MAAEVEFLLGSNWILLPQGVQEFYNELQEHHVVCLYITPLNVTPYTKLIIVGYYGLRRGSRLGQA